MKDALELHARGRPIVECELFDNSAPLDSHIIKQHGFVIRRTTGAIHVQLPKAQPTTKVFSIRPDPDGFLYERGALTAGRGWRMQASQLDPDTIPIHDTTE